MLLFNPQAIFRLYQSGVPKFPFFCQRFLSLLLYDKDKGELNNLLKYRPISLINVDVNIFTEARTNRLRQVLPSVIHHIKTAVGSRRIDSTIHTYSET